MLDFKGGMQKFLRVNFFNFLGNIDRYMQLKLRTVIILFYITIYKAWKHVRHMIFSSNPGALAFNEYLHPQLNLIRECQIRTDL